MITLNLCMCIIIEFSRNKILKKRFEAKFVSFAYANCLQKVFLNYRNISAIFQYLNKSANIQLFTLVKVLPEK